MVILIRTILVFPACKVERFRIITFMYDQFYNGDKFIMGAARFLSMVSAVQTNVPIWTEFNSY